MNSQSESSSSSSSHLFQSTLMYGAGLPSDFNSLFHHPFSSFWTEQSMFRNPVFILHPCIGRRLKHGKLILQLFSLIPNEKITRSALLFQSIAPNAGITKCHSHWATRKRKWFQVSYQPTHQRSHTRIQESYITRLRNKATLLSLAINQQKRK